jgi:Raf kinase inhibitor-like YbhB/YbcL family protein
MGMSKSWLLGFLAGAILAMITMITADSSGGETMKLSSSAFKDGDKIPMQYVMPGAGGRNLSIPLTWANPPAGTQSFALAMVDPHPVARNWVHWLVIDLPANANTLAEGASGKRMPPGAVELKNSFGDPGYGGPQPPRGTGDHPYVITVYALSAPKLDLGKNPTLAAFQEALAGKILAQAGLTGYYGR